MSKYLEENELKHLLKDGLSPSEILYHADHSDSEHKDAIFENPHIREYENSENYAEAIKKLAQRNDLTDEQAMHLSVNKNHKVREAVSLNTRVNPIIQRIAETPLEEAEKWIEDFQKV